MNKDFREIEEKLKSLPKPPLKSSSKSLIQQSLREFNEVYEHQKSTSNSLIKRVGFSLTGAIVIGLFLILLVSDGGENDFYQPHSFVAEAQLKNLKELDKFDRLIKFPTYLPFEVSDIHYEEQYLGPMDVMQDEVHYLYEDDPAHLAIRTFFLSLDESNKQVVEVEQWDVSVHSLLNKNHFREDSLIEMEDGKRGLYFSNGAVQILSWEEDGVTFDIIYSTDPEDWVDGRMVEIPLEELIKIAESFETFKR
ncbi:hypothetical protein [Evansella tamaricis]|uniref:DUF4367 domain-containing protein n=1 Tax=Evansella tamaricis TaxID=2069301 RepID=A0ABS6JHI2_9BACI|nr:hypothetical protein [Evansella tamaricis]MBU9713134.1 hypothetical protein [Evansella tamaricis]